MSPSQVHYVAVPFPAMTGRAFRAPGGRGVPDRPLPDASGNPLGGSATVRPGPGPDENFPLTGYVTTRAWMARYPKTAAAFTRALERGQQVAAASRPAVEKALAGYTTIGRQTAANMATGSFPLVGHRGGAGPGR